MPNLFNALSPECVGSAPHVETNPQLPGFAILRNWIAPDDAKKIILLVRRDLASGWKTPKTRGGLPMSVKVACWGEEWSAQGYSRGERPIPGFLCDLARRAVNVISMQYARWTPETAICNWYEPKAKLGLHVDRREDWETLMAGLPIVTFCFGDDAQFQICPDEAGESKPLSFRVSERDALLLTGWARRAYHGISKIFPASGPMEFGKPGRLSITMRQVHGGREPLKRK